MIFDFMAALSFLTVLPTRQAVTGPDLSRATAYFPLVGLLLGSLVATVFLLPFEALARGVVMLIISVVLTGALHEDACVDVADAAFAPVQRPRRLVILGDPHVGAHGLSAAILILLARFVAYSSVPVTAVLAAPVVGRWIMVLSLATTPPLFTEGLGASLSPAARPWSASVVALGIIGTLGAIGPTGPLLAVTIVALGSALLWAHFLVGRFGGLNGDGHGSVGMLGETVALLTWTLWEGSWS